MHTRKQTAEDLKHRNTWMQAEARWHGHPFYLHQEYEVIDDVGGTYLVVLNTTFRPTPPQPTPPQPVDVVMDLATP